MISEEIKQGVTERKKKEMRGRDRGGNKWIVEGKKKDFENEEVRQKESRKLLR